MTRSLSIYLDLMRVLAALLVLLFHTSFDRVGGAWLHPIFQDRGDVFAQAGSAGVIVFFVLSGFVISWTAATKERTFESYIVNCLARLWSVVIPALRRRELSTKSLCSRSSAANRLESRAALCLHTFLAAYDQVLNFGNRSPSIDLHRERCDDRMIAILQSFYQGNMREGRR
jgi:hypothetical protein